MARQLTSAEKVTYIAAWVCSKYLFLISTPQTQKETLTLLLM